MNTLDDQNFLTYLQQNYPYLYKTEMVARKVMTEHSGNGEVSISLGIKEGRVYKWSILLSMDEIILRKKDNIFEEQS